MISEQQIQLLYWQENPLHSCILIGAKMMLRFKTATLVEVMELKEAAEKLDAQKNRINWWFDENSLEKDLEMILIEQLDKVLKRVYASAC